MKKITDFLKTKRSKEELKIALDVLKEFKEYETMQEWEKTNFMEWAKVDQLEEFLEYLVNNKKLSRVTTEYLNRKV